MAITPYIQLDIFPGPSRRASKFRSSERIVRCRLKVSDSKEIELSSKKVRIEKEGGEEKERKRKEKKKGSRA
jgi:hypothetical protein